MSRENAIENLPPTQTPSARELAGDLVGCLESPEDLSNNPDYFQGFGE
ncbi:hypothetical protein [Spirulina major]|nr:hypothetical protein [Spirulina major]